MRKFIYGKLALLCIYFCFCKMATSSNVEVIRVIDEVTTSINMHWSRIEYEKLDEKQNKLLELFRLVSLRIQRSEELHTSNAALTMEKFVKKLPINAELTNKINAIIDIMDIISTRYSLISDYEQQHHKLLEFAAWIGQRQTPSSATLMDQLHTKLFGSNSSAYNSSLLMQLATYYEDFSNYMCTTQSAQQFVDGLFTRTMLIDLKGYVLLEFSYLVLRELDNQSVTQQVTALRANYSGCVKRAEQILLRVLANSGRTVWRCDPAEHVVGETYEAVTRLLQGYVVNEMTLNDAGSCWQTCDDYHHVSMKNCRKDLYCGKQFKCAGHLYSCRFIDANLSVCGANASSIRQYEFIQCGDGRSLGQKQACEGSMNTVNSWWNGIVHCSYCFCLCDQKDARSDRYFSLRASLSDFKENYVVTGIRFIKLNRVFHLQIQQGKLLPDVFINQSTLYWQPLEAYSLNNVDLRSGYDYHALSYRSRSVDLDEITAVENERNNVVTGVRLQVVQEHLNLEVRFSKIDLAMGQLIQPELNSFWKSNVNLNIDHSHRRRRIQLHDPLVSIESPKKSVPLSVHNQYISFASSSLDADAAQTTLPYIDVQDVVSSPAVPLTGIGIYYKGYKNFGGFLAPKIITYNLNKEDHTEFN